MRPALGLLYLHLRSLAVLPSRIVVHYGEIGTKGGNRQVFETCLRRNIKSSLETLGQGMVRMIDNRFFVEVEREDLPDAEDRLGRVFGIAWFGEVEGARLDYGQIREAAFRVLSGGPAGKTFRVSVRRANKSFGMKSQELAGKLGEDIIGKLGLRVDLSSPESTLFVDVISREALVYRERRRGLGGLPVGVSGSVLHLLSGGIDSPVAAWLMMKRGCLPVYLHFYVAPSAEAILQSKVGELVRILSRYGGGSTLVLIPFTPYQLATTSLPPEFEPIVFRRFMRVVAERIAIGLGLPAISTGDNLAQVASQTLQNISCIDSGSSMPTLRPVLGYDKDEIIKLAKRVGTYETSILDYKDCCSIVSRHPKTRMKVEDVDEASLRLGFPDLAARSIELGAIAVLEGSGFRLRSIGDELKSVIPTGEPAFGPVSPAS